MLTTETNNRKQALTFIGAICGFLVAFFLVQKFIFSEPSFDKQLAEIASELNKTCPMMVDEATRLNNAVALPNNTFQYNYTLITTDKQSVDTTEMKSYMTSHLINLVKTNPQLKPFRDKEVTMNYYYQDMNNQYLFLISIAPKRYQ